MAQDETLWDYFQRHTLVQYNESELLVGSKVAYFCGEFISHYGRQVPVLYLSPAILNVLTEEGEGEDFEKYMERLQKNLVVRKAKLESLVARCG